ncbi:MAG: tRNA (cytosine(32)/uridine(32)-2'-O)-methyltransferase TrmJ [Proteobacteria bacterium]|nr:MAG: tRNA (cytosine(32)/uridine(32)-2'-O)-methyltransferase TrmJ [Pseudomonadota bacterium]
MYQNVRVVLMETSHSGNIGAVARAMKNMGLETLYLVSPRARWDNEEAIGRSAGSGDVLQNTRVVDSLSEAIGECSFVVGASARSRRIDWPCITPRVCAAEVCKRSGKETGEQIALVFGREDRGLSNEELQRCHTHVFIPANPEYTSLNLAMAVQVLSYELRMAYLESRQNREDQQGVEQIPGADTISAGANSITENSWDDEPATMQETEMFLAHLERTMTAIDYYDPGNPRQLMARIRRLYLRCRLGRMEVNILRGILTATEKAARNTVQR